MLVSTNTSRHPRPISDDCFRFTRLVNTGWSGGKFGVGKRCPLKYTRAIIDAIHDGSLAKANFTASPVFNLQIPDKVGEIPATILDPRKAWADSAAFDDQNKKLAVRFLSLLLALEGSRADLSLPQDMFTAAFDRYKADCAPEGELSSAYSMPHRARVLMFSFSLFSRLRWTQVLNDRWVVLRSVVLVARALLRDTFGFFFPTFCTLAPTFCSRDLLFFCSCPSLSNCNYSVQPQVVCCCAREQRLRGSHVIGL